MAIVDLGSWTQTVCFLQKAVTPMHLLHTPHTVLKEFLNKTEATNTPSVFVCAFLYCQMFVFNCFTVCLFTMTTFKIYEKVKEISVSHSSTSTKNWISTIIFWNGSASELVFQLSYADSSFRAVLYIHCAISEFTANISRSFLVWFFRAVGEAALSMQEGHRTWRSGVTATKGAGSSFQDPGKLL